MQTRIWFTALMATCFCATALATDRADYNRSSAERFVAMFHAADVSTSNAITRDDAEGSIELVSRFDDIDINRDGTITLEELTRFIDASFG